MTKRPDQSDDIHLACKVCLKEIPKSVAKSLEGPDYVYYFCGGDCFEQWQNEKEANKKAR